MPVNSTHPDFDANLLAWMRARDVYAGEDAVKAAGPRYLPRLDCQDDAEYAAYIQRASFFNATARTADGFVGLIFRREPAFKLPQDPMRIADCGLRNGAKQDGTARPSLPSGEGRLAAALKTFLNDADMLGTRLSSYAQTLVAEIILVGRAGTLIDWSGSATCHYAEERAYVARYKAEDIINWRTSMVNGRQVLSLVVLRETVASGKDDGFVAELVEQIRVLRLEPLAPRKGRRGGASRAGQSASPVSEWQCVVEIWQSLRSATGGTGKKGWQLIDTRVPLRLGKPLPLIPFVFHGPRHSLPEVDKIPLADIIAVNLDHYRLSADYKHGMHFTALPTAWVSGFDKNSSLRIGSSTAWVAETPGATAGFLEFHGQGLTTFERAMDRDEQLMAVLGTRMLESRKRVGETAAAIELRQSGENSILNTVSLSVSAGLTQVLRWVYWWNSTEPVPDAIGSDLVLCTLNTDFSVTGMSALEITALVAAWQAGAISQATMLDLFRAGEVIAPGRTNDEEIKLLQKQKAEIGKAESASARAPLPTVPGDVNAEPVVVN
jgi:hypothetical protein